MQIGKITPQICTCNFTVSEVPRTLVRPKLWLDWINSRVQPQPRLVNFRLFLSKVIFQADSEPNSFNLCQGTLINCRIVRISMEFYRLMKSHVPGDFFFIYLGGERTHKRTPETAAWNHMTNHVTFSIVIDHEFRSDRGVKNWRQFGNWQWEAKC